MIRKKSKGQALLETLVILSIYITMFTSIFQIVFIAAAKSYVNHQLYHALICMAQDEPTHQCQKKLIQKSKKILAWGELKNIQLKRREQEWTGTLTLSIYPWNLKLGQELQLKED